MSVLSIHVTACPSLRIYSQAFALGSDATTLKFSLVFTLRMRVESSVQSPAGFSGQPELGGAALGLPSAACSLNSWEWASRNRSFRVSVGFAWLLYMCARIDVPVYLRYWRQWTSRDSQRPQVGKGRREAVGQERAANGSAVSHGPSSSSYLSWKCSISNAPLKYSSDCWNLFLPARGRRRLVPAAYGHLCYQEAEEKDVSFGGLPLRMSDSFAPRRLHFPEESKDCSAPVSKFRFYWRWMWTVLHQGRGTLTQLKAPTGESFNWESTGLQALVGH